jgi:hypothetical protein
MKRFLEKNETAIDKQTGLMWAKNASLFDFPLKWEEALNAVKELNNSNFYGYSDWKIPNRRELFSLISHKKINPSLPDDHPFINIFNNYYWTSSTCLRLPDQAWHIHLGGARVVKGLKHQSYMAWPVRTTENYIILQTGQQHCFNEKGAVIPCTGTGQDPDIQPKLNFKEKRFTKSQETIHDNATGLMWLQNANIYGKPLAWETASKLIAEMNTDKKYGYNDWRLPNIIELESLVDLSRHSPALPFNHLFTDVQDFYWSSTTSAYETNYAWVLYLIDGMIGVGYKSLPEFYLWPVRGQENLIIQ